MLYVGHAIHIMALEKGDNSFKFDANLNLSILTIHVVHQIKNLSTRVNYFSFSFKTFILSDDFIILYETVGGCYNYLNY